MAASLYKYLTADHANWMLERGNIRLGTLYEYRTHWNDQVRDEDEAKFTAHQYLKHYTRDGEEQISPLLDWNFRLTSPNSVIIGGHLSNDFNLPDRNIYCTTMVADEAVMKAFECDACIAIIDPQGFASAILDYLRKRGLSSGMGDSLPCTYDGKILDHSRAMVATYLQVPDPRNPGKTMQVSRSVFAGYFAKKPVYEPQKERRLLVEPAAYGQKIDPIICDIPGIIPFIKRHTF